MKLRQNWTGGGMFKKIADILNSHARWMTNIAGFDGCQIQQNAHSGSVDIYAPRQIPQLGGPAHDVGDVKYFLPPGASLSAQLAQIGSGWHFLNGATVILPDSTSWTLENCRGKYFVGFDDSDDPDADYDAPGVAKNSNEWQGYKGHGENENGHPAHDLHHTHLYNAEDCAQNGSIDVVISIDGPGSGTINVHTETILPLAFGDEGATIDAATKGDPTWTGTPADALSLDPDAGSLAHHPGIFRSPITAAVTAVDNTDNRPPSCVAFALIWIGLPTVNGILPTA